MWVGLCVFFTLFLLPYFTKEAFGENFILGVSFIWSVFWAISFAHILKNPAMLILIYVCVVFSHQLLGLFGVARESALQGDWLSALIMVAFSIYLILETNRIERGDYL